MFTVDTTVPESLLPKNGTYSAQISKAELAVSKEKPNGKGGNLMIKLELTIPPTDEKMVEQKISNPVKVFDYVVFPCDASGAARDAADLCKIHANNFIKAAELEGKENSAVADLTGKMIGINVRRVSDDNYGDKLTVSKFIENSLKSPEEIPF